jgi:hypothetical protein
MAGWNKAFIRRAHIMNRFPATRPRRDFVIGGTVLWSRSGDLRISGAVLHALT